MNSKNCSGVTAVKWNSPDNFHFGLSTTNIAGKAYDRNFLILEIRAQTAI
jgi:hypothetical protein